MSGEIKLTMSGDKLNKLTSDYERIGSVRIINVRKITFEDQSYVGPGFSWFANGPWENTDPIF